MSVEASQAEMNRFVKVVDDFMRKYKALTAPKTRAAVIATQNPETISNYESTLARANTLKATIEGSIGAWNTAKSEYEFVQDSTSIRIGDAIDTVRGWFGYNPMGGLSALPAAAWIAGIVSAAYLLNKQIDNLLISISASRLQSQDPTLSRSQALMNASAVIKGPGLLGSIPLPLIGAGAIALFLIFRK